MILRLPSQDDFFQYHRIHMKHFVGYFLKKTHESGIEVLFSPYHTKRLKTVSAEILAWIKALLVASLTIKFLASLVASRRHRYQWCLSAKYWWFSLDSFLSALNRKWEKFQQAYLIDNEGFRVLPELRSLPHSFCRVVSRTLRPEKPAFLINIRSPPEFFIPLGPTGSSFSIL